MLHQIVRNGDPVSRYEFDQAKKVQNPRADRQTFGRHARAMHLLIDSGFMRAGQPQNGFPSKLSCDPTATLTKSSREIGMLVQPGRDF